jgi:hypothetical protein
MRATTTSGWSPFLLLAGLVAGGAALSGCVDPGDPDEATTETVQAITGYQVVTAETAVTRGVSKQLSVSCPAGLRALGAGWAALDPTRVILRGVATYFEPSFDGTSWLVNAKSTGSFQRRWKLEVRVLCGSAALAGYEVVASETELSTASFRQHIPVCPAGKRSLGAGWSVLDSTSAILDGEATHFEPSFDGTGWLINARNSSSLPPAWKLRSRLICVDATAVAGYEVLLTETAATTAGFKQLSVSCPAGKRATSLGWSVLDSTSAILEGSATYSQASFDGSGWLTNAENAFALPWKLRVRLICTL